MQPPVRLRFPATGLARILIAIVCAALAWSAIAAAPQGTASAAVGPVADTDLKDLTRGREPAIETAFLADIDKTELSEWLYNGTLTKPGDLGYWVGYRIVKSYYQHSADKRQALSQILDMMDPRAFFARSGWYPGIR